MPNSFLSPGSSAAMSKTSNAIQIGLFFITVGSSFVLGYAICADSSNRVEAVRAREEQAAIVDYEGALSWAQREYDAMRNESSARIGQLEAELEVERDTREYWRQIADQKAAEASRYKSLAAFVSGTAN